MTKTTIREARRARGLTLEVVALHAPCSYGWLSRVERGAENLTPAVAACLAPVLGVPPEALLAGQAELRQRLRAEGAGALVGAPR